MSTKLLLIKTVMLLVQYYFPIHELGKMRDEKGEATTFCAFNCLLLLNCSLEWRENTGYGQSAQNERISRFDNYVLPTWPTSSMDSASSSLTNQQKHCAGKTGNDGCKYCGTQCLQPCWHMSKTFINAELTMTVTQIKIITIHEII